MPKQQQLGENKKIRLWSIGNSYFIIIFLYIYGGAYHFEHLSSIWLICFSAIQVEICTNSKKSPKRISWSLFFFPLQFKLKDARQIHTYCMYLCIIFYTRKKTIIHRVKDDRNIFSKQQNPEQEKSNTDSPHILRFHFVHFTLCATALLSIKE